MNTVKVMIKTAYGIERIYPANDTAKLLLALIRRATFYRSDLETIKALGFEVELINAYSLEGKDK